MTWFGDIFAWIGTQLSALWDKAGPEASKLFKLFVHTFEQAAIDAVRAEAMKTISGEEKLANAMATVEAVVIAAGWKAGQTAIQTLVQDAYASWKASQGAILVEAPAA